MEGWIKLHRRDLQSELWLSDPFGKGQAWYDMVALANHESGYVTLKNGRKLALERGDLGWSELSLAARWGWSRGKVRRFFADLKNAQKITVREVPLTVQHTVQHSVQQTVQCQSVITICNYDHFNGKVEGDGTALGTALEQQNSTLTRRKREVREEYSVSGETPPTTEDAAPTTKAPRAKREKREATRLPRDFELPREWVEFSDNVYPLLDPQRIFKNFVSYWAYMSEGDKRALKADWFATWRNWLAREDERGVLVRETKPAQVLSGVWGKPL